MTASLPFDTSKFDELPINIIICTPVLNADGSARDYRIVFGNEPFAQMWSTFKADDFVGEFVGENFLGEKFLLTPLKNLPAPYVGFILTDVTDYEKNSARKNFLRMIRHMEGATLLLRDKNDGRFEVVNVSKGFAKLMQCSVASRTPTTDLPSKGCFVAAFRRTARRI